MKYWYGGLVAIILLVILGAYIYYKNSLDGFTAQQSVQRTGNGELLDDIATPIGRVILYRRPKTNRMGLVVPTYEYFYQLTKRRSIPLFWHSYNGSACTPQSPKNVLTTIAYYAHRYNALPGADNLAADASVVCGYATSPQAASVAVTFSDATIVQAFVRHSVFFIVNDKVAQACTIQVMDQTGAVIETRSVHYQAGYNNWQSTQPCP